MIRKLNKIYQNNIKIKSENAIGMSEESNSAVLTYKILPDINDVVSDILATCNDLNINLVVATELGNVTNADIVLNSQYKSARAF